MVGSRLDGAPMGGVGHLGLNLKMSNLDGCYKDQTICTESLVTVLQALHVTGERKPSTVGLVHHGVKRGQASATGLPAKKELWSQSAMTFPSKTWSGSVDDLDDCIALAYL